MASGKPSAAREELGWLLYFRPRDPDALLLLGASFRAERSFAEAAEAFGRVPREVPQYQRASLERALTLLQDAQLDSAETALRSHLEEFPASAPAREELQWLYFNEFRPRDLERLLEDELARDPANFHALKHLLLSEFRNPVPREGLGYLEEADKRRPGQSPVLRALGYCYWRLGDVEKARELLQRSLNTRADDIEARLTTTEFLMEQGEFDLARRVLFDKEAAGGSEPAWLKSAGDRGHWLKSRFAEHDSDFELALRELELAFTMRPFELKYVHRRGTLLHTLGRNDAAADALKRAAELEVCQKRLTEIVYSGALETLTAAESEEIAELCERRGRASHAAGWHSVANRLRRGERLDQRPSVAVPHSPPGGGSL